jgi:opacity protein-like surface antigen
MKRGSLVSLGLVVLAAAVIPATANAQYLFVGGGASIAIGDFKDYAKTGWIAQAGLGYDIASVKGLFVEAEGFYGSNKHSDVAGDKTNIIAGMGVIGYSFTPDSKASPYVLAGAGFQSHKFDPATGASETSTKFGYTGAAGVGVKLNQTVSFWVEGRLLGSKDSKMIPVSAGFTFNFGKKGM